MYLFFVVALFALAITDLVVGVSNDAVNFLNSAVGSRAGSRRLILMVAALGILAGALFSTGMMEVARKGIFNPQMFTFAEVMVIFLAVMLTDILLLDLFNTFGMPTSTTVSIVFELLGAAVILALIKVVAAGGSFGAVVDYINSSRAILIVSGIFLSIIVAFSVGAIGQYISRMVFSFHYEKRLKRFGGLWGGTALTILGYFLLIKGLKGAAFVTAGFLAWVNNHTFPLLVISFIIWTIIFQLLVTFTRVNILKTIVLIGTFTLAMAFASNDLVNFIGVPIAGFASFRAWNDAGHNVDMLMTSLSGPVKTPVVLLSLAGLIMVITLWRSKKARTVTATEVNLSRQGSGRERFKPNGFSTLIVQLFSTLHQRFFRLVPVKLKLAIARNYRPRKANPEAGGAAFDLVRASVNLTIASVLIAIATLNKLPLSTTYVSFMVAMGTSLADRAWGGSAEYRVAGVVQVVTGWLLTGAIAFAVAALFAGIIFYTGMTGVLFLLILLVVVIYVSNRKHAQVIIVQAQKKQPDVGELSEV